MADIHLMGAAVDAAAAAAVHLVVSCTAAAVAAETHLQRVVHLGTARLGMARSLSARFVLPVEALLRCAHQYNECECECECE